MNTNPCCPMPEVTVVVPVYQVEDWIAPCLDSIAAQTYRNFEVVFVDDCGSDGSVLMVESFIANHPELPCSLLHHERNRGLSAARNTGIAAARGSYVLFLDSDDRLQPASLSLLTAPLAHAAYDFVVGNYTSGAVEPMRCHPAGPSFDALAKYAAGAWYVMAWNKLCRTAFLKAHSLYFAEGLNHEDVIWSFRLACCARSMYIVPETTYLYSIREASIMTGIPVRKDAELYIRVFDEIRQFILETHRTGGKDEYTIFEGKRCGIMYSLLHTGRKDLFFELYPAFRKQAYLSPWKALRTGVIGWSGLVRDLHYALPAVPGCWYKYFFYKIVYQWSGRPVKGLVWQ